MKRDLFIQRTMADSYDLGGRNSSEENRKTSKKHYNLIAWILKEQVVVWQKV